MILSIFAVIIMFSVIILVHEAGHFFFAKKVGIRVEKFSLGFGPKLFSVKKGDTVYQVCLILFGGFVKMAGDDYGEKEKFEKWEYMGKSPGHRAQVIVAGSLNNLLLGLVLLVPVFILGVPGYEGTKIGSFVEGLPAEKSGLQVGDEVLEVNGVSCTEWFDVLMNIRASIDNDNTADILLKVKRNGEILQFSVAPASYSESADISAKAVFILGISPMEKMEKYNFLGAVARAGKEFNKMIYGIFMAMKMLFTRQVSAKQLTGPIGIAQWGAEIVHYGLGKFLYFMAFISVNLGIINLMPFPVLDGGHLFGIFIERITGVTPRQKTLEIVQYVGIICIIFLALYVTYNDILRVLANMVKSR
ncbi:MAG TPA: RIP metalloprotease RseP [bacterium]|nr:RIP metalloprotease RseP [bacterium]